MATPNPALLPMSGRDAADMLTNGTSWSLAANRVITWAVADAGPGDWAWNAFGAQMIRDSVARALDAFSEVANVRFEYQGWYSNVTTAPADIVVTATNLPIVFGMGPSTYARAFFPNEGMADREIAARFGTSTIYPNASGDVALNFTNSELALSTFQPGSNGQFALLHEIGHSLGLKHPHDNGGQPGRPTFDQLGYSAADTQRLTIMSYDPATSLAAWLQAFGLPAGYGYPESLMPLDVVAIQSIYGPNLSTRAGDTVYSLFNDNVIATYWDASGRDALSAVDSSFGWRIESIVDNADVTVTLAVPYDWTSTTGKWYYNIEGFAGSNSPDRISSNSRDNAIFGYGGSDLLAGRGGNDLIDGGSGIDIAEYSGALSNYAVYRSGSAWTIQDRRGAEGTDSLNNVERLVFSNAHFALDTDARGHAGQQAQILRAILGPASLLSPVVNGVGIGILDNGYSYQALANLAVDAVVSNLGLRTNRDFVRVVFENVVGQAADRGTLDSLTSIIDSGQMSIYQFASAAAQLPINVQSVELIGLASTGVEFVPFDV